MNRRDRPTEGAHEKIAFDRAYDDESDRLRDDVLVALQSGNTSLDDMQQIAGSHGRSVMFYDPGPPVRVEFEDVTVNR